jgi:hypothetical protein
MDTFTKLFAIIEIILNFELKPRDVKKLSNSVTTACLDTANEDNKSISNFAARD